MAWTPKLDDQPSDVLHSAVKDTRAKRFEDALQKILWFHEASRSDCGLAGVRLSFALGYGLNLAAQYPPASTAFTTLRDDLEQRCRKTQGDFDLFHDVAAFNEYLGDDRRTIDLFMEIAKVNPGNAKQVYRVAEKKLAAAGMFRECAPFLQWERRVEVSIMAYQSDLRYEDSFDEENKPAPPKFARRHFESESARLIALLSLNGRKDEAGKVRDLCLAVVNDDSFQSTLDLALMGKLPSEI